MATREYGAGKSRLYAEMGKEEAFEQGRYARDISSAEGARAVEEERKSWWSLGLGALGGALLGPVGLAGGYALGKIAPDLFGTVGEKPAEGHMVRTDAGKFNVQQRHEFEDINRQLQAADRAQTWKDVADIGTVALTAYTLGGGKMTDPSNFSFTQFGGQTSGTGMGLFGEGAEGISTWDKWMGTNISTDPGRINLADPEHFIDPRSPGSFGRNFGRNYSSEPGNFGMNNPYDSQIFGRNSPREWIL